MNANRGLTSPMLDIHLGYVASINVLPAAEGTLVLLFKSRTFRGPSPNTMLISKDIDNRIFLYCLTKSLLRCANSDCVQDPQL